MRSLLDAQPPLYAAALESRNFELTRPARASGASSALRFGDALRSQSASEQSVHERSAALEGSVLERSTLERSTREQAALERAAALQRSVPEQPHLQHAPPGGAPLHADAGQQPPATRIGAWPTFDVAHRPANFGSTFATSGEGSTHSDQQPAMSVDRPTTNHDPAADDVWLEQGQEVVHETRPSDTPLQEGAQDPRLLIAMLASGAALQGDAHTHARRAMSDGVATNPLSTQRLHGANAPQPPPAPPGATAVADNRIAAALQPSAGLTHSAVRGSEAQEAMQSSSGGARSHAQVLQTQSSTVVLAHGADVVQAGVARAAPVAEPQVATPARMTLAQALGERLHVQIGQRSEHASIRLDPPSMGSIEVVVRHEAGSIQVHLRASNADVARQLQGMGEALRQDLSQRQQGEVAVHVWDASRDGEGRRREQREAAFWREQAPGRALDDLSGDVSKAFALAQE